jgi:hypothetical protein
MVPIAKMRDNPVVRSWFFRSDRAENLCPLSKSEDVTLERTIKT